MKKYIIPCLFILSTLSCKKEEPTPNNTTFHESYLKNADTVVSYSKEQLLSLAQIAGYEEYSSYIKTGATSLKVSYNTRIDNENILVSGMLYMPGSADTLPASLLSIQHGTTFRKSDAPTETTISPSILMAAAGYITFEPDYIGYGDSKEYRHPYYDKTSSASCVTDFIKAGKEFLEMHSIPYKKKLFMAGYSEGGYVTLTAQEHYEKTVGADINIDLVAVAAGAGGYDLNNMLDSLKLKSTYPNPGYLAFLISAYDSTYSWKKGYSYYFNQKYAEKLPSLLDGYHSAGTINQELTIYLDSLFDKSFYQSLKTGGESFLSDALFQNSLTNWKPEAPLRLYHGTEDEVIPYQNTINTYNSFLSLGAGDVKMMPINGGNHGSSFELMVEDFLLWFEYLNTNQ